jgi:prolyl oligopeptidase
MKRILYSSLIASFMTFLSCKTNDPGRGSSDFPDIPLKYDIIAKDSVKEDYFGNEILDPYRWLEDDNSPETKEWVLAQNKLTFNYLDQIPFRQGLKSRITELMNYEKQGAPFKEANSYFFFRNDGLQNQDVLFRRSAPN